MTPIKTELETLRSDCPGPYTLAVLEAIHIPAWNGTVLSLWTELDSVSLNLHLMRSLLEFANDLDRPLAR
jgi:hypothetical protein